jgi:hypothetical protein
MPHKKLLAFTILGAIATPLWSGQMGDAHTITEPQGWGAAAQALYLQANYSSLGYIGSTEVQTFEDYTESFKPKDFNYGFGFKVEAFYQFKTGRDVNLNWYHYDHTSTQGLPDGINVYDTVFNGTVLLKSEPKWNAVNLELGQKMNIDTWGRLRFHGGLQYADMSQTSVTTGTFVAYGKGKIRTNRSSYNGVGPRVGLDVGYFFKRAPGVELITNVATGLLIGHHKFIRQAVTYNSTGTYLDQNNGTSQAIVTAIDAKIGVSYHRPIARGDLRLDAGWMVSDYFNPIEIADSFHHGRTKESNFAIQGPYFGLKYLGNVA